MYLLFFSVFFFMYEIINLELSKLMHFNSFLFLNVFIKFNEISFIEN